MERTHVVACLVLASLFNACRGPGSGRRPVEREVRTSDPGEVHARCGALTLVVTLDDDDDDRDGQEDRRAAPSPAEDNLRKLVFDQPEALHVLVGEPVIVSSGATAIGSRLRAFESDKATPFDFTRPHAVPATLYLEGIAESAEERDLGFEFQYSAAGNVFLCGGTARGTVVKVRMRFTGIQASNTKLLAQGRIATTVEKRPNAKSTFVWSYDGDGSFADATKQTTDFAAGNTFTPARGSQLVRCTLVFDTTPPGTVVVTSPLDVTAPRSVSPSRDGDLPAQPSNVISTQNIGNVARARATEFELLRYDVDYTIRDQFDAPIRESERGGATVTAREDVPLRSAIPAGVDSLQGFFDAKIPTNTSVDWRPESDGVINDNLRLGPAVSTILALQGNQLRLIPNTVGQAVVTMDGHNWFVSVNEDPALTRRVTNNSLRTTVIAYQQLANGETVQFSTVYTVRVNP